MLVLSAGSPCGFVSLVRVAGAKGKVDEKHKVTYLLVCYSHA